MLPAFRKLVCRPKIDDWSPLARFFYADEALNTVAAELDSFDGRKDPERCAQLVSNLRQCQDRALQIIEEMLVEIAPNPNERAPRDYRVKFPDDILHENLAGQLWFGAECLTAGSNIIDHEFESEALRPLAKTFTFQLDTLRDILKDQSLRNPNVYSDKVQKALRAFDYIFAEFELNYVSTMVPVKDVKEYDIQLDVAVLFSETLMRALQMGFITPVQIEECDPSIMITLPRLGIVGGLLLFPDGPLNVDRRSTELSEMFRPFQTLLQKIRDLLRTLDENELSTLEKALCSQDEPTTDKSDVTLISDYRTLQQRHYAQNLQHAMQLQPPNAKVPPKKMEAAQDTVMPSNITSNSEEKSSEDSTSSRSLDDSNVDGRMKTSSTPDCPSPSSSSSISDVGSETEETPVRIAVMSDTGRSRIESVPDVEISYSELGRTLVPAGELLSPGPFPSPPNCIDMPPSIDSFAAEDKRTSSPEGSDQHSATTSLLMKQKCKRAKGLRARFRSSADLIHRLFVCIAGVADQLQSNYPADLRAVLKMVLHPQDSVVTVAEVKGRVATNSVPGEETATEAGEQIESPMNGNKSVYWVPDHDCPSCVACKAVFSVIRRRHHCRNCGQIFCGRCSANCLPLPDNGHLKPVRVCNRCFLYKLNPFENR